MKAKGIATMRFASSDIKSMREFKKHLVEDYKFKSIKYEEVEEFYDWKTHVTISNVPVGILEFNALYYTDFGSKVVGKLMMKLLEAELKQIIKSNKRKQRGAMPLCFAMDILFCATLAYDIMKGR